MQNSGTYRPRSISSTLSVGLIITLVLVAGLSLGFNFILSSRKAKAELQTRVEEYVSALTDALKVPLWNYSEETIEAICASYAQNEFVAKLLLEDQTGSIIFKKWNPVGFLTCCITCLGNPPPRDKNSETTTLFNLLRLS